MSAGTVTVEWVPWRLRTDVLTDVAYVVTERRSGRLKAYHLPDADAEKALPVVEYGRKVAVDLGAQWVEPAPWVPGAVDTYTDIREDGNGLVRNRRARRPVGVRR